MCRSYQREERGTSAIRDPIGARCRWHPGKPGTDGDDFSPEPQIRQSIVNRAGERSPAGRHHMPAGRIPFGRHRAGQQGMSDPDRANEIVAKDELSSHLGCGYSKYADFKIDVPFPERTRILVGFGREAPGGHAAVRPR